jgi:hypothetical protein
MQLKAYNDFIDNRRAGYDFAAFWDIDEFLCLKKFGSLDEFLLNYSDCYGVGVNWRVFGDNGLSGVSDGNYSLLSRFTKGQKTLDRHVKTILNLNATGNMFHFVNPHFVDASMRYDAIVDVDRTCFIHGPWNYDCKCESAQINHYHSKTWPEFQEKMKRGKADTPLSHPRYNYLSSEFMTHNFSEVEDLAAKNFYETCT